MTKILALMDGSSYMQSVLEHTAWVALRLESDVELLHVLEQHPERTNLTDFSGSIGIDASSTLLSKLVKFDEAQARLAIEQGHELLDMAKAHLHDLGVSQVHADLRRGQLADNLSGGLNTQFNNNDFTIIGKQGMANDAEQLRVGAHLEDILRRSKQPVLLAPRNYQPILRVLVAFDGSPGSCNAIKLAAHHPLMANLDCHVVMVGNSEANNKRIAWAESLLEENRAHHSIKVLSGKVVDSLLGYADANGINLLLMGAYGHSKLREWLLGSTTLSLIKRCRLPMLVMH